MIKKIVCTVISVFCIINLVPSSANALVSIGVGGVANYAQDSAIYGYGLDVELPFLPIPLFTSRLEVNQLQSAEDFSLIPIMLTESFQFPLLPFYAGFGVGVTLFSSANSSFVSPSGVMNYSAFVGYQNQFAPLTSYYIQIGYEVSKFDYEINSQNFSFDRTGMGLKGGLRFGF